MWETLKTFVPPLRWVLLLLVLAVVFALIRVPAGWAAHFMTRDTTLGLSGVSGSLWEGQARMASVEVDSHHYALGALHWDLSPLSLLTLSPCADVEASLEGQTMEGRACASASGRLTVTQANIDAPAQLLQEGLPFPVRGRLSGGVERMALGDDGLSELKGNLVWSGARVHAEDRWVSLGRHAAEYHYDPEQDAVVANVFDLDAPLTLDVVTRLPLSGGIFIEGELELSESFSRDIQAEEWLPMVLEHRDGRHYRVDLQF